MKSSETDNFRPALAVLTIGYGNLLRSDDGAGPAIVSRLAAMLGGTASCAFLTPHQLTPELAEEIAGAERVIFVDASVTLAPGEVSIRQVSAGEGAKHSLNHHVGPGMLLSLAESVFGRSPRAWLIEVGAKNLKVGDRLSPVVSRAADRLCRRLSFRIRRWCRPSPVLMQKESLHVLS